MTLPVYSMVISTYERPESLAKALESLVQQDHLPASVIVVDSSTDLATAQMCQSFAARLPLVYQASELRSAAMQRNAGAKSVTTPLVGFMDDDVILYPATLAKLCAQFANDPTGTTGGVGGRIADTQHPQPSGLLWAYYRLQAGYRHSDYGGKLFGPAINCYPCFHAGEEMVESDWLNSTCVVYRTEAFAEEQFPEFSGYSFMEDVHLSARVAKRHRLYYVADAVYEHHSQTSVFKRDHRALARSQVRHRRMVSQEIMGLTGLKFELKFLLHRLFCSIYLLRNRMPGWKEELAGTWT